MFSRILWFSWALLAAYAGFLVWRLVDPEYFIQSAIESSQETGDPFLGLLMMGGFIFTFMTLLDVEDVYIAKIKQGIRWQFNAILALSILLLFSFLSSDTVPTEAEIRESYEGWLPIAWSIFILAIMTLFRWEVQKKALAFDGSRDGASESGAQEE